MARHHRNQTGQRGSAGSEPRKWKLPSRGPRQALVRRSHLRAAWRGLPLSPRGVIDHRPPRSCCRTRPVRHLLPRRRKRSTSCRERSDGADRGRLSHRRYNPAPERGSNLKRSARRNSMAQLARISAVGLVRGVIFVRINHCIRRPGVCDSMRANLPQTACHNARRRVLIRDPAVSSSFRQLHASIQAYENCGHLSRYGIQNKQNCRMPPCRLVEAAR